MRISHRVRAMRTALKATTRRILSRFSVEEFIRDAVLKDLELLRSKYHRQVPSYATASDLAACIELHGLTESLISEGVVLDGVYLLDAEVGYEVCLVTGGRRSDLARYKHLHAASIDYVKRLLVEIDRLPGDVKQRPQENVGVGQAEVNILQAPQRSAKPRLATSLREPRRSQPAPTAASGRSHLRLLH